MATINSARLERIDDGPVATVYSGQHAGAVVALKVFPKRLDKRTLAAFNKEQAKLSTVRRVTSILPVDGVDELDTGEFAVRMERCAQSLAALVDRVGSLRPADAVVLGRAVAVALVAAHGAGVVHGGLSPHNILFRTTGEPVVSDFGVTLRQTFARDPLYAIEFLPPETLRTGVLNEATDLYGLGAVLHYALSGRSPHPGRLGEQPGERVLRILGEPVPAINNPDVPVGLSTLVARLLAADPARRLGDASAVADRLGAMLPGAPRRPTADDFDDFSNPHPAPVPPARQAPPPPPVAGIPAVGEDFDDFAVPAYPGRPAPPVSRPADAPPRVGPPPVVPPPLVQAPVARAPVAPPPVVGAPVVAPPVPAAAPVVAEPPADPPPAPEADEGNDANRMRKTEPAADPAAGTADRAAQLRALRRERLRSVSTTPRAAGRGPSEPAEQPTQNGSAPTALPLATLTPAPTEPLAATPAAPSAPSPTVPSAASPMASLTTSPAVPSAASPEMSSAPSPAPSSALLSEPPTAALPTPAIAEFRAPSRPPAVHSDLDFDDDFAGVANPRGGRGQVKVLASPLAPPGQAPKRLLRYDVLAGAALLIALLALVPLLLLRGDPEEISSTPQLPPAGGSTGGDVEIELAEPVDLTDKVRLNWTAPEDLDFIVVVAAEGKNTDYEPAERNLSMTLPVEDGLQYCFQVQATDGNDVYESNVVALRDATCRK